MSTSSVLDSISEFRRSPLNSFLSNLVDIPSESSISRIIGYLNERGVYEVFLPEASRCGVVTVRDLLKATNLEAKLASIMEYLPVLSENASVGEAARIMADYRMRAVPVTDGKKISAQVNCVNVLEELQNKIDLNLDIAWIASGSPVTITEDTSVDNARDLMIRKRFDHLPVTKDKKLTGIVTSALILSRITPTERIGSGSMKADVHRGLDFPARELMETDPVIYEPGTPAGKALKHILATGKSYTLVTQWGELQAIATYRDFMTVLAGSREEAEVPTSIVGLPDDPFEAELAKTKFIRSIKRLYPSLPNMLEARSVIKSKFSREGKTRGRYEVSVTIRTPRRSHIFTEEGWDLGTVYDHIVDKIKRLMARKPGRRRPGRREQAESL